MGFNYKNRIDNISLQLKKEKKNIAIMGIIESFGQPLSGFENVPILARDRGLLQKLSKGYDVSFEIINSKCLENEKICYNSFGSVIKNAFIIGNACYNLHLQMLSKYNDNKIPILIGGDHSIVCGSISSAVTIDDNIGIIWIDAHADINTPLSSRSMNMHGMPLSFLLGLSDSKSVKGFEWMNDITKLKPRNLIYIGLRSIDEDELEFINDLNIKNYSIEDIKHKTIESVMDEILLYFSEIDNIHISWDIDSIDPLYAPCTGTKVNDGLSINESICIAKTLSKYKNIKSIDMVEINPLLCQNVNDVNKTVDLANYLISILMRV